MNSKVAYATLLFIGYKFFKFTKSDGWVLGVLGCKIATGGVNTPNTSAFIVHGL